MFRGVLRLEVFTSSFVLGCLLWSQTKRSMLFLTSTVDKRSLAKFSAFQVIDEFHIEGEVRSEVFVFNSIWNCALWFYLCHLGTIPHFCQFLLTE